MEDAKNGARWEPLCGGCRVLVTRQHTFGTDAVLLADFAMGPGTVPRTRRPFNREAWADLGAGCGVIPLLWHAWGMEGTITGVELQPQGVWQARRSVEDNGLAGQISIVQGDVRRMESLFAPGSLDRIACNPPYTAEGAGIPSGDGSRRTARQGESLSLEELAQSARYALRFGGRLCVCLRPQRLGEAMGVFRRFRLEPKRLRLVQSRLEKPPFLFLLECRSGGNPGLAVEPVLLLEDGEGRPTAELEAIYGDYRDNPEHRRKGGERRDCP